MPTKQRYNLIQTCIRITKPIVHYLISLLFVHFISNFPKQSCSCTMYQVCRHVLVCRNIHMMLPAGGPREVMENKLVQYFGEPSEFCVQILWQHYCRESRPWGGAESLHRSGCALITLNSLPVALPGAHVNVAFWTWVIDCLDCKSSQNEY